MTSHLSERFHDLERHEVYLDLIRSGFDRPSGAEQAWLLDRITSNTTAPAPRRWAMPRISLRWFSLPSLPVPFVTWASS